MILIFVAVDVNSRRLKMMLAVELGVLVNKDPVVVKDNVSAKPLDLGDRLAQTVRSAKLGVCLIVRITVVKASAPPAEYQKGIKPVLLAFKIKPRQVGVFPEYLPELMAQDDTLPAGHVLDPLARLDGVIVC